MNTKTVTGGPIAKTEMLVRRGVETVYEAFVDPAITSKFWFSKGSDRLDAAKTVRWDWEMFGFSIDVSVQAIEPNRRIVIAWPGDGTPRTVEWLFDARPDGTTLVRITESGFAAADENLVEQVADSTGGFNLVLAGLKAYLEHGVMLNLVADRFPDGLPGDG